MVRAGRRAFHRLHRHDQRHQPQPPTTTTTTIINDMMSYDCDKSPTTWWCSFRFLFFRLLSLTLLVVVSLIHLRTCPYSKVEESFQIQATHDIYYYGIPLPISSSTFYNNDDDNGSGSDSDNDYSKYYDHLQYPGVVPRTFVGPTVLALLCRIVVRIVRWFLSDLFGIVGNFGGIYTNYNRGNGDDVTVINAMTVQFLARLLLLTANLWGWYRLSRSVDYYLLLRSRTRRRKTPTTASHSTTTTTTTTAQEIEEEEEEDVDIDTTSSHYYSSEGSWLLVITACQFHMPYYGSRMLPNSFALVLVLQCYACWIYGSASSNASASASSDATAARTSSTTISTAASILVITTTVFRCDLLLLLFCVGISWIFVMKQLTIIQAIKIGVLSGGIALLVTVPYDSLMWNLHDKQQYSWVWPEGSVLYFNTVLGQSSNWGTEVWYWYFTSAIPKMMLLTLLLVPLSTLRIVELLVSIEMNRSKGGWKLSEEGSSSSFRSIVDTTWLQFIVPIIGFVTLYSCLGHKEVRFIFPAVPILNLAAASGMTKLQNYAFFYTYKPTTTTTTIAKVNASGLGTSVDDAKKKKDDDYNIDDEQTIMNDSRWPTTSLIGKIGFGCGILCILLTLLGSSVFVMVSKQNYPGGVALQQLTDHIVHVTKNDVRHHLGQTNQESLVKVNVHIANAAAMSGVSLFGQRAAQEATNSLTLYSPGVKIEWTFSKDGYEEEHSSITKHLDDYEQFTHLLSEEKNISPSFHVVRTIEGSPRISISEMKVVTQPTIYVLERRNRWWE